MEKKKIAVIAPRLKCVDGVSVEAEKWINKFVELGYDVHLICGKLGEPTELSKLEIHEMDTKHSEVKAVRNILFGSRLNKDGKKAAQILLNNLAKRLKPKIKSYITNNKINMLCVENILAKPSNPALTLVMNELVKELKLPTIARYHDFYWNNSFFTQYDNFPKLMQGFPSVASNIVHVTTTNEDQKDLFDKRKVKSKLIHNVIETGSLKNIDEYNADFRKEFGIKKDQLVFLQPTRIMRRKCIEKSIKLVSEINDATKKDNVLLITGQPAYFEEEYVYELMKKVKRQDVDVIMAHDRIFLGRHHNKDKKFYSIGDAYAHSDFVLYPVLGEDSGTPILEAMAYKKPILATRFPTLLRLVEKGANFVLMGTKITKETVSDVFEVLVNKQKKTEMVDFNQQLVKEYFSSVNKLDEELVPILKDFEKPGMITRVFKKYVTKEKTMYDLLDETEIKKGKQNNKKENIKKEGIKIYSKD